MLPKLHGFDLCSKIVREFPEKVPVIIVTNVYKEDKYKNEAIRTYGASAYFVKPYDEEKLLSTIYNFLGIKKEEEIEEELPEPDTVLETILSTDNKEPKIKEKKMKDEDIEKKLQETLSSLEMEIMKKESRAEVEKEIETKLETTLAELGIEIEREKKKKIEKPEKPKPEKPKEELSRLGEYILLEKIGSGGMGEVFKATRKGVEGFEKTFAIKRIHPHLVEENEKVITMFIDEAKIASQLSHPNIVHIYDLGKIDNYYYIAMEYVLGKDLEVILNRLRKRNQLMPYEYASLIGIKICQALDYAHRKHDSSGKIMGIVHRDVSPKNILISYEGEVKLTDFGVAKAASKIHQTIPGGIKGKIPYMSPEQAKGEEIDHRSDIYSLGSVLYEMCTGKKAFTGETDIAILDKVRKGEVTLPSQINPKIPKQLESIILKAMKYKPEDRYQSVNELKKDLEKFLISYKGEIPTYVDIARFMSELFSDEIKEKGIIIETLREPHISPKIKEKKKVTPPVPPTIPEEKEVEKPRLEKAPFEEYEEEKKKSPLPLIIGLVAILLIGGGALYYFKFGKTSPTSQVKPVITPPSKVEEEKAPEQPQAELAQKQPQKTEEQPVVSQPPTPQKPAPTPTISRRTRERTPAPARETRKRVTRPTPTPQPQSPAVSPPSEPKTTEEKPPTEVPKEEKPPTPEPEKVTPEKETQQTKITPPQQKIKTGDIVPLNQVDSEPVVLKRVEPKYPPIAKRMGVSGVVIINALISENGDVIQTVIIKGIKGPYGLNEAAEKAVQQWKFKPALKDGVRVKVWKLIPIRFTKQ
jgi:serine/threonine-protein kinase